MSNAYIMMKETIERRMGIIRKKGLSLDDMQTILCTIDDRCEDVDSMCGIEYAHSCKCSVCNIDIECTAYYKLIAEKKVEDN
jgi:K+ transporter